MRQLNNIPNISEQIIKETTRDKNNKSNFLINDIYLFVPPTSISIHKENLEYSYKTLRSQVSTKILSGNGSFHAQINITIPPEGILQLHRLICQVKNSPFVYIENKFIEESMMVVSQRKGLMFTLFGISVQNHPSSPASWLVELDLRYFNHKPYMDNIFFLRYCKDKFKKGVFYKNDIVETFLENVKIPNEMSRFLSRKTTSSANIKLQDYFNGKRFFDSSYYRLLKTRSPVQSDSYIAYSNFLQIRSLYDNFNIEFALEGTKLKYNQVGLSKVQVAALCGFSKFKEKNTEVIANTVGLHELAFGVVKIKNKKTERDTVSFIKVRNKLINLMLSSGLYTMAVIKNFVKIDLSADFLARYTKSLLSGTKGLNKAQKKKKIDDNKKEISNFFAGRVKALTFNVESTNNNSSNKSNSTATYLIAPFNQTRFNWEYINQDDDSNDIYFTCTNVDNEKEYFHIPLIYTAGDATASVDKRIKDLDGKVFKKGLVINILGERVDIMSGQDGGAPLYRIFRSPSLKNKSIIICYEKEEEGKVKYLTYKKGKKGKFIPYKIKKNDILAPCINHDVDRGNLGTFNFKDNDNVSTHKVYDYYGKNIAVPKKLIMSGPPINIKNIDTETANNNSPSLIDNTGVKGKYKFLDEKDKNEFDKIQEAITNLGGQAYRHRSDLPNILEYTLEIPLHNNYTEEDIRLTTNMGVSNEFKDDLHDITFEAAITNVSCSLRHICTSLPIIGQEYPTHQYLGSIEPLYQFNLVGSGAGGGISPKLRALEAIRASTSYMAKNFPEIPDASNFHVKSFITMLFGSSESEDYIAINDKEGAVTSLNIKPKFIVNSIDTSTIEGNPGAVSLNFRFSESKAYVEEEMKPVYTNEVTIDELKNYVKERQAQGTLKNQKESIRKNTVIGANANRYIWTTKNITAHKNWYPETYFGIRNKVLKDITDPRTEGNLVSFKQDKIAYEFCLRYIEPLQSFLNTYQESELGAGRELGVVLMSTFDAKEEGGKRKTKSNHFFNSGADIYVTNMGSLELFLICNYLFPYDDNGGYKTGIGIYGANEVVKGESFINLVSNMENGERVINESELINYFTDSDIYCNGSNSRGFVHFDWGVNVSKTINSSEMGDLGNLCNWFKTKHGSGNNKIVMHYGKRYWADHKRNDGSNYLKFTLSNGTELPNRPGSSAGTFKGINMRQVLLDEFIIKIGLALLGAGGGQVVAPYVSIEAVLSNNQEDFEEPEADPATEADLDNEEELEEEELATFANNFKKKTRQVFDFTSDEDIKASLKDQGLTDEEIKYIKIKRTKRNLNGKPYEEIEIISAESGSSTENNLVYNKSGSMFKTLAKSLNNKKYIFVKDGKKLSDYVDYKVSETVGVVGSRSSYKRNRITINTSGFTKDYYKDIEFQSELNANENLLLAFPAFASALLTEPFIYVGGNQLASDIYQKRAIKELARIKEELYGFDIFPNFYGSLFQGLGLYKNEKKISKQGNSFSSVDVLNATNAGTVAGSIALAFTPVGWVALAGGAIGVIINSYNTMAAGGKFQYDRVSMAYRTSQYANVYRELYKMACERYLTKTSGMSSSEVKEYIGYLREKGKFETDQDDWVSFYERTSDEDTLGGAYVDFAKNIYSKLKAFKDFNKEANFLASTSAARALIKKSTQEIIYENVNNLSDQQKYEQLVLSKDLTGQEILDFLDYCFTFPKSNFREMGAIEEDIEHLYEFYSRSENKVRKKEKYYKKTKYRYERQEFSTLIDYQDVSKYGNVINDDMQYKDYWYNSEEKVWYHYHTTKKKNIADHSFVNYFEVNREKIKQQQERKLAFLKNLLEALLKENISLNKAGTGTNRAIAAKYGLNAENFFDLTNNYTYPDNQLKHFDDGIYSERFHPGFYYYDYNDYNIKLDKRLKKQNASVQQKVLDSSIKFGENLRKFVYSGPTSEITKKKKGQGEITKNEALIDRTSLISDTSDFFINVGNYTVNPKPKNRMQARYNQSGENAPQVAPIGFSRNTDDKSLAYLPINIDTELVANNRGDKTDDIIEELKDNIDNQMQQYKNITDSFGSEYGYKLSSDTKRKIEKTSESMGALNQDEISGAKTNLGLNNQKVFDRDTVLDLTEDAYKGMLKRKSMKNAFPTFALYLIEEDEAISEKYYAFDDFFYYNSVISFSFHNSRESSSTIANIQLQNISGILDGSRKDYLRDVDLDQKLEEDKMFREGNYIDSIVLRPGITVQLRAGYEADANELDVLISGLITDINYSHNSALCNITVQSFGVELEAIRKGNSPDSGPDTEFDSTHQLLGSLMMSEELKHFGRHRKGVFFQSGEYRDLIVNLEIPKKDNLFKFNYTRGWMDFFTENSFSTMFTVGVVTTIGLPLLGKFVKVPGVSKVLGKFDNVGKVFQNSKFYRYSGINFIFKNAGKLLNPLRIGKGKGKGAVNRAFERAVAEYKKKGGGAVVRSNNGMEYIDDIIAGNYGGTGNIIYSNVDELLDNSFGKIFLEELSKSYYARGGYLWAGSRSVLGLVPGVARATNEGSVAAGQNILRSLIKRRAGISALALDGFVRGGAASYSYEVAGLLANTMLGSLSIRNRAVGFLGASMLGLLLAGIDVTVDVLSAGLNKIYQKFILKEDRRRMKQQYIINPKDDNIFCPHPNTYMRNHSKDSPYEDWDWGLEPLINNYDRNLFKYLNDTTFGLISLVKNVWQGDNINVFSLVNKQLDVTKGENKFFLTGQTIWQVLHECTLRHPGWIYGVRPYEDSLEYRVFFGVPNQRYFKRRLNANIIRKLDSIASLIIKNQKINQIPTVELEKVGIVFVGEKTKEEKCNELLSYWLTKTKDRYVPYRQFHNVSSKENLIANNIIVSGHNVINATSTNYIDIETSADNNPSIKNTENQRKKIYKAKANSYIPMERIKEKTTNYRNCINITNAVRYSLGELLYGMRNMYEGSLLILGDTKINPWDVCILSDAVNDMFGPVEIKSVTHNFSYETGFITELECSAVVTANEELTQTVVDQAIIYETRKRIFNEFNSKEELISSIDSKDKSEEIKYKERISREVREVILKMIEDNSEWKGFLQESFGIGTQIQVANNNRQPTIVQITEAFKKYFDGTPMGDSKANQQVKTYMTNIVDRIYDLNTEEGTINYLNELNVNRPGLPKDFRDQIKYPLMGVSGVSLGVSVLSKARAGRLKGGGLKALRGTGLTSFLFFGATAAIAFNADNITNSLLDSATGGVIGKSIWREKILSRMESNQLVKVFPLYKGGQPLLSGGMEFVNASERWTNILGNIYNGYSNAIEGYMDRKNLLQETGSKAFDLYNQGEFTSWTSTILLGGAGNLLGLRSNRTYLEMVGYIYSED